MFDAARRMLGHLRKNAKTEKAKELEKMAVALEKLREVPEWELYERFLSLQIEGSLRNMLKVDTQTEFNKYAGERNGLLKAMDAHKHVQNERAFLRQLGEEGEEDTS